MKDINIQQELNLLYVALTRGRKCVKMNETIQSIVDGQELFMQTNKEQI